MKPGQLAAVIGACCHCALELYADGPVHHYPDGTVAHVACAAHARRQR